MLNINLQFFQVNFAVIYKVAINCNIIQKKSPLFKMVRINNSRQEHSRERVYNFYIENKSLGKRYTINHFKAENFPERTIYSIIERAENENK